MIPHINKDTVEGIVSEIFSKNKTIGLEEFQSEEFLKHNRDMAVVVFSLIDTMAEYFSSGDEDRFEEICCASKIAAHLVYKSISKQMEINEWTDK